MRITQDSSLNIFKLLTP